MMLKGLMIVAWMITTCFLGLMSLMGANCATNEDYTKFVFCVIMINAACACKFIAESIKFCEKDN